MMGSHDTTPLAHHTVAVLPTCIATQIIQKMESDNTIEPQKNRRY
jgi:hypothetical protein